MAYADPPAVTEVQGADRRFLIWYELPGSDLCVGGV